MKQAKKKKKASKSSQVELSVWRPQWSVVKCGGERLYSLQNFFIEVTIK